MSAARLALRTGSVAAAAARSMSSLVLTAAGYPRAAVQILRQTMAGGPHGHRTARAILGRALVTLAGWTKQ